MKLFIYRLFRWEFWPLELVYFPVVWYILYLGIRFRNLFFFTLTNPNMEAGGLFSASKFKQLQHLPPKFKPKTFLIPYTQEKQSVSIEEFGLEFPIIAKPDNAERGKAVKLIQQPLEFEEYLKYADFDVVIQEYIPFDFETGVLFYKFPNDKKGTISSIVLKSFLKVCGDGENSVELLLSKNSRNRNYIKKLRENNPEILEKIPAKNEECLLEPIGNHNRGTVFLNGNRWINEDLENIFTEISSHIPDFYYGRFDLRSPSLDTFLKGQEIKIVEVNGVNAEPAHIYEPGTPLLFGLKTILNHWKIIYRIAVQNKKRGYKPSSWKEMWALWNKRKA